jgi:thiamine-monophosphate kinase
LHGGEDYELLFTARPNRQIPRRIAGVSITQIGRITHSRRVTLFNPAGVGHKFDPQGWEHFRK